MYDAIIWFTVGTVLLIASFIDLKTREIPDWISYGTIFTGFFMNSIISLTQRSFWPLIDTVVGFAILTGIGFGMYYLGQWGGGDSKILMGIGACLGIPIRTIAQFSAPPITIFLVLLIFVGAFYGLLYSFFLVTRQWKSFRKRYMKMLSKYKLIRRIMAVTAIVLVLVALFLPFMIKILILTAALVAVLSFHLWIYAHSIEDSIMLRKATPQELTIGDWIAKDVVINNKVIVGPSNPSLEKEHLEIILKNKEKIPYVLVRDGIPFLPSFFISFIIYVWILSHNITLTSLF